MERWFHEEFRRVHGRDEFASVRLGKSYVSGSMNFVNSNLIELLVVLLVEKPMILIVNISYRHVFVNFKTNFSLLLSL